VLCNREIKFKQFADYAAALGADLIATGHYARGPLGSAAATTRWQPWPRTRRDGLPLLKGVDANKDQSYFLQAVPRGAARPLPVPAGELDQARGACHRRAPKACTITARRTAPASASSASGASATFCSVTCRPAPGPSRTWTAPCRRAQGLAYYTLGQRQGLGIGGRADHAEAPWYVAGKRLEDNVLVVTQDEADLLGDCLMAVEVNWLVPDLSFRGPLPGEDSLSAGRPGLPGVGGRRGRAAVSTSSRPSGRSLRASTWPSTTATSAWAGPASNRPAAAPGALANSR
jgi:tRNA-uridine 2-sulfurtransferase